MQSDLGRVVDISSGGARIQTRGKLSAPEHSVVVINIHAPAGNIRVAAHVIWRKKVSFRRWEAGVSFVDVRPETRQALNLLARGIATECDLSCDEP